MLYAPTSGTSGDAGEVGGDHGGRVGVDDGLHGGVVAVAGEVDRQLVGQRPIGVLQRGAIAERAGHDVGRLRVEDAGLPRSPRAHEHGVVVDAHADVAEHVLDQAGARRGCDRPRRRGAGARPPRRRRYQPGRAEQLERPVMARPVVAVIPGDDAAPEAVAATMTVLRHLDPPVEWDELPPGSELAAMDPAERELFVRARIDAADTVLFGSTNGTTPGRAAHAVGAADVRQRAAGALAAGLPLTARPPRGHRLRHRAGEPRGRLRRDHGRRRRPPRLRPGRSAGPARQRGRGPLRGEGDHPRRHRAGGPLLVRAGPPPTGAGSSGHAHRVGEDEHAAARPTAGSATSWPRSAATTPTSR